MKSTNMINFWATFSCHEVASSGTTNVCPCVLSCVCHLVTECLYLPISLRIQLESLWNFKPKLLCYKPMIPTCLFAICNLQRPPSMNSRTGVFDTLLFMLESWKVAYNYIIAYNGNQRCFEWPYVPKILPGTINILQVGLRGQIVLDPLLFML